MNLNRNKIKLSPRLKWGVGRQGLNVNFFKIGGALFLLISSVLVIRAGYLLLSGNNNSEQQPQVLGAVDNGDNQAAFTEYKVKSGDTLFSISKDYNIQWTALATLNNLQAPFALKIGQTIKIPKQ